MSDVPLFFPTQDSTTAYNEAMLKRSSQLTIIVEAMDSPPSDITQNMQKVILAAAKNKDVHSTGNLPFTLTLKVGQLYEVTANLAVSDGIINGAECHIKFIECNCHNLKLHQCVWLQFMDPAIGKEYQCKYKSLHSQFVAHKWTPIQSIQQSFIAKWNQTVTHTQFPISLASAHSIHVALSSMYTKTFVDMSTEKSPPKQWWELVHSVAFSYWTSL